jgi:hypothetical protein
MNSYTSQQSDDLAFAIVVYSISSPAHHNLLRDPTDSLNGHVGMHT